MNCPFCEQAKKVGFGVTSTSCTACCARLVLSARPSRRQQEAMFAFIERFPDAPSREEILAHIKVQEVTA
jgi:hypothetical protein